MNRNFALEFVRATEMAAIASARLMGRGDAIAAERVAVDGMRATLESIDIDGTIVVGEGEKGDTPFLYRGEKVGSGHGPRLDIAVEPLEGTRLCATGANNAISVMAVAHEGNFMKVPDIYMYKIAVGPIARGVIDVRLSATENLKRIAAAKKCKIEDLTTVILDRPRHQELIAEVRSSGARIQLITDGDVSAALATCYPGSGIDVLMGSGGAPEGVMAAAAFRCVGGDFQSIMKPANDDEVEQLRRMGLKDVNKVYSIDELARGHVMFCATGVTDGNFLHGVKYQAWGCTTDSVVLRSETGTVRRIRAEHHFDRKPGF